MEMSPRLVSVREFLCEALMHGAAGCVAIEELRRVELDRRMGIQRSGAGNQTTEFVHVGLFACLFICFLSFLPACL